MRSSISHEALLRGPSADLLAWTIGRAALGFECLLDMDGAKLDGFYFRWDTGLNTCYRAARTPNDVRPDHMVRPAVSLRGASLRGANLGNFDRLDIVALDGADCTAARFVPKWNRGDSRAPIHLGTAFTLPRLMSTNFTRAAFNDSWLGCARRDFEFVECDFTGATIWDCTISATFKHCNFTGATIGYEQLCDQRYDEIERNPVAPHNARFENCNFIDFVSRRVAWSADQFVDCINPPI